MHQRDGRTDGHRTTAKTALMHSVARVKVSFVDMTALIDEVVASLLASF